MPRDGGRIKSNLVSMGEIEEAHWEVVNIGTQLLIQNMIECKS